MYLLLFSTGRHSWKNSKFVVFYRQTQLKKIKILHVWINELPRTFCTKYLGKKELFWVIEYVDLFISAEITTYQYAMLGKLNNACLQSISQNPCIGFFDWSGLAISKNPSFIITSRKLLLRAPFSLSDNLCGIWCCLNHRYFKLGIELKPRIDVNSI